MRSNTLLFLHVLVAMGLLGGLLTATAAGLAAGRRESGAAASLRTAALWGSLVALAGAVAVVVLGEWLASREDLGEPGWLDVSRVLAIVGLLGGGAALAVLAGLARERARLARWVGWLALLLTAVALTVAFLMATKPA